MTYFVLSSRHYDYTENIGIYTRSAMESKKLSWLNAAKANNNSRISDYNNQIDELMEKKQELILQESILLAEEKRLKEADKWSEYKMLNKERKQLLKAMNEFSWKINNIESKIISLKVQTDSELIESYMDAMDYCFEEVEFYE